MVKDFFRLSCSSRPCNGFSLSFLAEAIPGHVFFSDQRNTSTYQLANWQIHSKEKWADRPSKESIEYL